MKQWDFILPQIEFAYNRSMHRTVGNSMFNVKDLRAYHGEDLRASLFSQLWGIDARASINTPNIGSSALIIEELDLRGQKALNTCENFLFGPHLGLGRQKNVVKLGQIPDVELPY